MPTTRIRKDHAWLSCIKPRNNWRRLFVVVKAIYLHRENHKTWVAPKCGGPIQGIPKDPSFGVSQLRPCWSSPYPALLVCLHDSLRSHAQNGASSNNRLETQCTCLRIVYQGCRNELDMLVNDKTTARHAQEIWVPPLLPPL